MANSPNPKRVKYTRSFSSSRTASILLIGEAQWFRDMELLLEDSWPKLLLVQDKGKLSQAISDSMPNLFVLQAGVWGNSELKLIDSMLPRDYSKLVVANSDFNILNWRRISKSVCERGALTLQLSNESLEAAKELETVLDGLIYSGTLANSKDHDFVTSAFEGFCVLETPPPKSLHSILSFLLSKFALSFDVLNAGMLLGETLPLWKKPLPSDSKLHDSGKRLRAIVSNSPAEKVLLIIDKLFQSICENKPMSEREWHSIVDKANFGLSAKKALSESLLDINQLILSQESDHRRSA